MTRRNAPRAPGTPRRGSIYVWVLTTSLMVSVIGLGSMAVLRLERERADREQNWSEAGVLAAVAVEHACATLANDSEWRDRYDGAVDSFGAEIACGNGFFNWRLQDPADADLNNATHDPVRIFGRGRVGQSIQACSVLAWPGNIPLGALGTAVHASGDITNPFVLEARGGTVSCDGQLKVSGGIVIGTTEAGTVDVSDNVTGGVATPAPAKALPAKTIWEVYKSFATEIPFATLPNGTLTKALLTRTRNDISPGAVNPDGVYAINVPANSTLTIRECRIEATLLLRLDGPGAQLRLDSGVVWRPGRADFPAMLACFGSESSTSASLACGGQLVESTCDRNFNPADSPFCGDADDDKSDTYTASLRGLFHIMRPDVTSNSNETLVQFTEQLKGCLLAEGDVRFVGDSLITAEPGLVSRPPLAYTAPPAPDNLVTNGGMENGLTGWAPVGEPAYLEWTNTSHTGDHAVRVRRRPSAAAGIRQDVTPVLVSGHCYDVQLWLKMQNAAEDALVTLEVASETEGAQSFTSTAAQIQTSWTNGHVQLTPVWTGELYGASLVVTTTTSTQRFHIDDVRLVDTAVQGVKPAALLPIVSTWRSEAAQ